MPYALDCKWHNLYFPLVPKESYSCVLQSQGSPAIELAVTNPKQYTKKIGRERLNVAEGHEQSEPGYPGVSNV